MVGEANCSKPAPMQLSGNVSFHCLVEFWSLAWLRHGLGLAFTVYWLRLPLRRACLHVRIDNDRTDGHWGTPEFYRWVGNPVWDLVGWSRRRCWSCCRRDRSLNRKALITLPVGA